MDPVLKNVARYVRDLLNYDEQLIKIGRVNAEQEASDENYIAIDSITQASKFSSGSKFNGQSEETNLYARQRRNVTISFYGKDAYENVDNFTMLQLSQKSNDLQFQYETTIFPATNIIDVKQLLGATYANRLDVSVNIAYNKQKTINTLRIDELKSELLQD